MVIVVGLGNYIVLMTVDAHSKIWMGTIGMVIITQFGEFFFVAHKASMKNVIIE